MSMVIGVDVGTQGAKDLLVDLDKSITAILPELQAAKYAGMVAIGITETFSRAELSIYANFVIDL